MILNLKKINKKISIIVNNIEYLFYNGLKDK